MFQLFLFCAVIGSTVLLLQLLLSVLGLGMSELEVGEEIPELDSPNLEMDSCDSVELDSDVDDSAGTAESSTSMFGRLSLRAAVAAIAFFGFAGMVSLQSGATISVAVILAAVAGFLAMLGVTEAMRVLYRLDHDGTVNVVHTLGHFGTVYLPVPAGKQGSGKVQIHMGDRVMEFEAVTAGGERLATGSKVVVTDVLGPRLLEVELDAGACRTLAS